MVVGTVAIILLCCILLFLDRYRSAMVQSARTSSSQAVSQVSNTVGSYLRDMGQAMELVEQSVSESGESRDWLLAAFLKYRPDVVPSRATPPGASCSTAGPPAGSRGRTSSRTSPST